MERFRGSRKHLLLHGTWEAGKQGHAAALFARFLALALGFGWHGFEFWDLDPSYHLDDPMNDNLCKD